MKYSIQTLSKQHKEKTRLSQLSRYSIFIFAIQYLFIATLSADIYLHNAQDALQIARAYNKEYELQQRFLAENVRLARKSVGAFLPSFEFGWSENDVVTLSGEDSRVKNISAGISQKVFDGGKSIMEYKMQVGMRRLEFYDFQKSYEIFESEVARSYYKNILTIAKCRALEDALQNAYSVLEIARVQFEQGLTTENDYVSTEVSVGKMELQLQTCRDDAASAKREFCLLVGIPLKERLFFYAQEDSLESKDAFAPNIFAESKALYIDGAVKNSIDLKKLSAEIDWAKKQRALQKTVFLPSVSVSGGIEFSGRHYPLTMPSYTLKLTVGFENNPWLPINVGHSTGYKDARMNSIAPSVSGQGIVNTTFFSQMKLSKINLSQKILSREKTLLQIQNSVEELIENIGQSKENIALNLKVLNLSEKKLALQLLQLEEGIITKSDYLESLTEYTEQKIQLFELRNNHAYMITQLENLTGIKI